MEGEEKEEKRGERGRFNQDTKRKVDDVGRDPETQPKTHKD